MPNDKTGIFLSGGGGVGAFHIGFFKALEEAGIKYDFVCGSSVGALVGGASTYLTPDEMLEAWNQLSLENVLKIDSNKIKGLTGTKRDLRLFKECLLSCWRKDPNRMIDVNDIRKLLYQLLDGERIRRSSIDFGISTTELPSFELKKIYKENMTMNPLEYILAAIYLPVFSRQVSPDGKRYIDIGGIRKYPIEMLVEKECNRVILVNIEARNLKKFTEPMARLFNHGEDTLFIDYAEKPCVLDFSREQSEINYRKGYETTARALERKLR